MSAVVFLKPEPSDAIPEGDPLPPSNRQRAVFEGSLEGLFRQHQPRILRQLGRSVARDAAPDLCQEAFLRIASAAETRTIAKPLAYLRRAAANLAIDYVRRVVRRPAFEPIALDIDSVPAADQIRALEARDLLRRLECALRRLKPRTREIFLAHRLDGYSYGEIAARTGLSVKAVEKHMSRAIAHLDQLDPRR